MTPQGRTPRTPRKATPSRGGYPRDPAARPGKKSAAKDPRRFADTPKRANGPQDTGADVHDPDGVRLQKLIAQSGLASRRASEDLIAAGRVQVDGQTVTELGVRVDPKRQVVHVDGVRLQLDDNLVYLALNKPPGVISTMAPTDPDGKNRPTLADYVTNREERLFHVGRLDTDTEGLIILTNDGTLANKLAHPSSEVPKTYLVEVAGPVARDVGRRLREGVQLDDGLAKVDSFKLVDSRPGKALLEIVLHSGRNRVIRRMMAEVGYPVLQLARIQIGPVRMGDLRSGRTRALHGAELSSLFDAAGL
ncbi:pseudouridine synthase [Spongisporangium articulatum]|uniref:Pseudouridine synthase n=1 Tax=Spongisporangium articulatum TaxID=3362603 RepID=A0ABW8ATM9_9ACTN